MSTPADLSGKVVVVTGGNSGIGLETCVALAGLGAEVVLGSRDEGRGRVALEAVRARSGAAERVQLALVDLSSFESIRGFAAEVLDRYDRLDVLVNNAGLILDRRQVTTEGIEMTIGVNHVGPFLLTSELLERMVASSPARVVNVSSIAHRLVRGSLQRHGLDPGEAYDPFGVYCRSKLANIMFTRELARRLAGTGVTANCLHPGMIRSGFGRNGDHAVIDALVAIAGRVVLSSPRRGARTSVHLASAPQLEGASGGYYAHRRLRRPSRAARDDRGAAWLWTETERLVGGAERSAP